MSKFLILTGSYTSLLTTLSFTVNPPSLSIASTSNGGSNPGWLVSHPTNKSIVYATQENTYGQVLSFTVNSAGQATQVANVYSGGQGPAHIGALSNGNGLFVINYSSGQAEFIPLTSDKAHFGQTGPVIQFTGSGPNKSRQTSSHPHEVVENGPNELLVPDLGADKVWRLTRNGNNWQNSGFVQHPAGSGPRHAVVTNGTLYTLHELSNTLTQHTLPALNSGIQPSLVATLPVIPSGASNTTLGAGELLISPVNSQYPTQYLYASNRNDPNPNGDTIAIFAINPLRLVAQVRTGLQHIRGMQIGGNKGQYIVAGGLNGGGIAVFERTNGDAALTLKARVQGVQSPSSFVFLN
jgi:6-phosphogluconolactonase (cycloisomerase 2 family)